MKVFSFLKSHPFAVEAFFESSTVLAYAVPKEELQGLIPECLELDTYRDKWAFLAVAMVQTKGLRLKGFPRFLGRDFFLIGYRIFVRYPSVSGRRLRGLYILRSETDKKSMEVIGNFFTYYKYCATDISRSVIGGVTEIRSEKSGFKIVVEESEEDVSLPEGSPFPDWAEARKFAGPMPFTFSYNPKSGNVLIIQGVRQNWTPRPVRIVSSDIGFIKDLRLNGAVPANAFVIKDVPYHWRKGRTERWGR